MAHNAALGVAGRTRYHRPLDKAGGAAVPIMPTEAPEIIVSELTNVVCDGGIAVGNGGHPRVYLTMGAGRVVDCPYCDRRFVLQEGKRASSGH